MHHLLCFALPITLGIALAAQADGKVMTSPSSSSSPMVGQLVDPVSLHGVEDVHLHGDYAYLPCRDGKRLTICAIADPANPRTISSFTHPQLEDAAGLAIDGDTLYLASQGTQRLFVLDASDKTAVRLLGSVILGEPGTRGVLYKLAYRDGYCYVSHLTAKKLFVVDVRDPTTPTVVGSVAVTEEDDGPFSVLLRGDYALVGTIFGRRNRLAVIDVKDPTRPRLVRHVLDDPAIGHLSGQMVGHVFYAVNWDANAFLVWDLANPANPRLIATVVDERLGKPNRCVVVGDRAYLPMVQGDGVAIVNVADRRNPRFVAAWVDPSLKKAYGIASRGDLLYVGARAGNSLTVLDARRLRSLRSP